MNQKLNFIFGRRSIRKFANKEIPDAMIHDLLEAGMAAPSAVATDPWRFIVVNDKNRLNELVKGLPNGKFLAKAAVGIVVLGDLEKAHDHLISYLLQDCCACIENMLLAAHALGLGACWLGVHPREPRIQHVRATLDVPESIVPVCVLALGFPAEKHEPRTRYEASSVHFDTWG